MASYDAEIEEIIEDYIQPVFAAGCGTLAVLFGAPTLGVGAAAVAAGCFVGADWVTELIKKNIFAVVGDSTRRDFIREIYRAKWREEPDAETLARIFEASKTYSSMASTRNVTLGSTFSPGVVSAERARRSDEENQRQRILAEQGARASAIREAAERVATTARIAAEVREIDAATGLIRDVFGKLRGRAPLEAEWVELYRNLALTRPTRADVERHVQIHFPAPMVLVPPTGGSVYKPPDVLVMDPSNLVGASSDTRAIIGGLAVAGIVAAIVFRKPRTALGGARLGAAARGGSAVPWIVGGGVLGLALLASRTERVRLTVGGIVSLTQLRAAMPKLSTARAALYLAPLNGALEWAEINTPKRVAAFLAQVGHESGDFRFMEEIWGPTDAQKRYEPPTDLATKLGNTQAGDGKRFKGRGPIQLTGRANYAAFSAATGQDFVGNPFRVAEPEWGFKAAAWYWKTRGLNALADRGDFDGITRSINGGTNGKADRDTRYIAATQAYA